MKLLLALMFALSLPTIVGAQARSIRLDHLQPNQRVEVEWRFQGCFSSGHYLLTFSSIRQQLQVEVVEMGSASLAALKRSTLPVTRRNLSQWDEALAAYARADSARMPTCTNTERVVVTLYEDGAQRAQEVLENKSCSSTKIWSLVDSLKMKRERTWPSAVVQPVKPRVK